jgi:exoribonuclease-2
MIAENSLVIYKNKPAIIKEKTYEKFSIFLQNGEQIKVRDKDIQLIHPGPVNNFKEIEGGSVSEETVREIWELLSGENAPLLFRDFTSFVFSGYTPSSAYAAYCLLQDGLYFYGEIDAIALRSRDDINAEEARRSEKLRETGERAQFLERLKAALKKPSENCLHQDDARFMQDIEAFACGKSAKSRTMKDLSLGESFEDAHSVLLKTGFWTEMVNPHPYRFGLTLSNAVSPVMLSVGAEERMDFCHLEAFAIDNQWSTDPDDAVSIEVSSGDINYLYVHVADPAASIAFNSLAEKEARARGATFYLPEGAVRMLAEESIPLFALGITEKSQALTFKMTIDKNGAVIDTEIYPSVLKVKKLAYEEADREMETNPALCALFNLAQKIHNRRTAQGAVNIELPNVHIAIDNGIVNIEPVIEYRSSFIVKECMIAAGEGAGTWAASRGLAFPYISQEVELQGKALSGFAGSMQLRRCMRPRMLSVKPGRHQGLGLEIYTQVTSPLRRYTDLLAHIQIRAFLRGGETVDADEISVCLGFYEAAATAVVHAERASNNHWIMVYLSGKKDSIWDAVAIENKGSRWLVIIPYLALETQVALHKNVSPNDNIKLILKSVNIAKGEAMFLQDS